MCVCDALCVMAALELGVLLAFVSRRETGRLTVDYHVARAPWASEDEAD